MISLPLHTPQYEKLHNDFTTYVRSLGYGGKKGKPYFPNHIREFLFFIENKGTIDIAEIRAVEIIAYQHYLKERPNQRTNGGLADTTITHHLLSLRMFFDYLLDLDLVDGSPARLPRFNLGKGRQRQILTEEEVPMVYAACASKRDRAIISLAYGCGLRRGEIYDLNTSDVAFHKGFLTVRDGKGGKSRTVPLADAVIRDLKEYVVNERHTYFRGNATSPAFLVNNYGNRMKADKINDRVKEIMERTNNRLIIRRKITLHCLRHSICTHFLDNGADVEFVQKFLGHKGVDMTDYYSRRRKQKTRVFKQFG
jgi:integrase/recombinase XerD